MLSPFQALLSSDVCRIGIKARRIVMLTEFANEASGHFPAPTNHIDGDPTPLDQAVYIPSVTPDYAIAAHKRDWNRPLPKGVGSGDLNFLDPNNNLLKISHAMSSYGQAGDQKEDCIITQRDRSTSMLICDSGGYQIATNQLTLNGDHDREKILRWLEKHADWAMTLDIPTGPLERGDYKFASFRDCLDETLYNLDFFQKRRKPGATKFLNVLHGNSTQQSDNWFEAVKGYEFEGWAFAGKLRNNFFNLCRRIIQMADEGLLDNRNWIHILGTNQLETAVGLTALQRAINASKINPHLRISYDTSSPFRMLAFHTVYSTPVFDLTGMNLKSETFADAAHLRGSPVRFPWSSPLGDCMTLGDICVREGYNRNSYLDRQATFYIAHHNLASLCSSIALANRVFDAETVCKTRRIASRVAELVDAITEVIQSGSEATLNKKRQIFNAVRKIEQPLEYEEDRETVLAVIGD